MDEWFWVGLYVTLGVMVAPLVFTVVSWLLAAAVSAVLFVVLLVVAAVFDAWRYIRGSQPQ